MIGFELGRLLLALLLALAISGVGYTFGFLSLSGVIAATILGGIVFGLGGLQWALLLIVFFASSSLLSKVFASRKVDVAQQFSKGGRRDWAQVAANGGMGAILILLGLESGWDHAALWTAFAASLAAVTADTWATELGVLSRSQPRLVTTGHKVEPGTSGGVSLTGNLAALAGALLIAVCALLLRPQSTPIVFVLVVSVSGFLGGLIDSFLGAGVQAIYYCPQHEKETEQHPRHYCGTETYFLRGWPIMNNDLVNFISAWAAALLAAIGLGLVG